MKIISVVGARPNFMKIAPFVRAVEKHNQSGLGEKVEHILVHTGHVERAPAWWVEHNLEWAYRMVKQPSRIKRQIHLLRFFVLLKLNRL